MAAHSLKRSGGILFFVSFLLIVTVAGHCQTPSQLHDLYQQSDVEQLQSYLQQNRISDAAWKNFVQALFETDGTASVRGMMAAYLQTSDSNLRDLIRERVSLYYAAEGSYATSSRIVRDETYFASLADEWLSSSPQKTELSTPQYGIQIGAFSTSENAEQRRQELKREFSAAMVIEKSREGHTLYTVVIGGYGSRDAAESAAQKLRLSDKIGDYLITQY